MTTTENGIDAQPEADLSKRVLSGAGWTSTIKATLCCPGHERCPLGCWAEADEED